MTEFGCPKCGRTDRLSQAVSLTIDTKRGVSIVVEDGKPTLKYESPRTMDLYPSEADVGWTGPVECMCGANFKDEGELRVVVEEWQPGDIAILPDGMRGTIATAGERLTVEGWHEEFEPRELTPLYPRPRSEPVMAAS